MYVTPNLSSTMESILLFFTLLAHISIISITCNAASKFPAILIFGDSTVDTGNNNFINTLLRCDHYPYGRDFPNHVATGRFSDGLLVPDFLASMLGIKELVPPYLDPTLPDSELLTGVSFASAGSGFDDLTTMASGVIPVSVQPKFFKEYRDRLEKLVGKEESDKIVSGALVFISAGTNDILFNYYDTPSRIQQFNISGYQDFLLQRFQHLVKELYDIGCRFFLVPGLAPIGCIPIQITTKFKNPIERTCLDDENVDARIYNSKLEKLLVQLQASLPGSKMTYGSLYDPVMDMINHPEKYGFLETNKGCCGTGFVEVGPLCNALTPTCPNPSQYLFWDAVHPGEVAYRLTAKNIVDNLIP